MKKYKIKKEDKIYTIYVRHEHGDIDDLNAEGMRITSKRELRRFISELLGMDFFDRCIAQELRAEVATIQIYQTRR